MKVIIHDLEKEQFQLLFPHVSENVRIISNSGRIRNCIGCFGCWLKTPGKCVINDGYDNMGAILSKAEEAIIISQCYYGGFSPFVKNVLDRSISYLLPFFKTKNDETHHPQRYRQTFRLSAHFYGQAITAQEQETAQRLVKANCVNFHVSQHTVSFYSSIEKLCKEAALS